MLTMLGTPRRTCDGITRRETLKVGALSLLGAGFSLPQLLAAEERRTPDQPAGKAKSVILLYLLGGAPTQDMWDLKPNAPAEVRGEFKPISTSVPGLHVCEHLPKMAKWMHHAAVVRSLNHKAGCHNTLPSYTGLEVATPDNTTTKDTYPPSMGSVCEYLRQGSESPAYVYMPCYLGWGQAIRRAGPYGGFLGKRCDPLFTEVAPYTDKDRPAPLPGAPQPVRGIPILPDSALTADVTIDRLSDRRTLLQQIDDRLRDKSTEAAVGQFDRTRQRAFDILTSRKAREAFDLSTEDPKLLDRYGRTLFGNCALIARRLVQSGVRFVNVTWDLFWDRLKVNYDAWDTHTKNFPTLKNVNLPDLDITFSALMQDLHEHGLLDETLVVIMSEMGRTPRINGNGGRDHWTFCYGAMFAGAGIRGGTVYGASDGQAAYVKDLPVSTGDICATIYECLGIDPDSTVPDRSGRPVPVANGGHSIREIMA